MIGGFGNLRNTILSQKYCNVAISAKDQFYLIKFKKLNFLLNFFNFLYKMVCRGKIDMWDVSGRTLISSFDAPDTTDVKWNPDGQHIVTSTCAPRLR